MLIVLKGFEACIYFDITIKCIYRTYEVKLKFTIFKWMFQLQYKITLTPQMYVFYSFISISNIGVNRLKKYLVKYANFNEVTWFSIYIHGCRWTDCPFLLSISQSPRTNIDGKPRDFVKISIFCKKLLRTVTDDV